MAESWAVRAQYLRPKKLITQAAGAFARAELGALTHAAIRRFFGWINPERWMERLEEYLVGLHIHDARPPAMDHLMPPSGEIDFAQYKRYAAQDICRVLEPGPGATAAEIKAGLDYIRTLWSD